MNTCPFCHSQFKISKSNNLQWESLVWALCATCDGGWRVPYTSELQDSTPDIDSTYQNYALSTGMFQDTARSKAQWLQGYLESRKVFIEIGPGLGKVIQILKENHSSVSFAAVEPNETFSKELINSGILIETRVTREAVHNFIQSVCKGKPAVVFLDNCLEHVAFPSDLIENLKKSLPKNSVILGEVPNEKGLKWRAPLQNYLRGFSKAPTFPGHINLFQKKSLQLTLNQQDALVWQHPIRTFGQIRYLSQSAKIGPKIRLALFVLNVTKFDRLLGLSYWLRFELITQELII
jgi:Methyltransferase domain